MSQFELSARRAEAITVLNTLRHCLIGRKNAKLHERDRKIIQEAKAIHESSGTGYRSILYNFQGGEGNDLSPSLELLHAIYKALRELKWDGAFAKYLNNFFRAAESLEGLSDGDRDDLKILVTRAMKIINEIPAPSTEANAFR